MVAVIPSTVRLKAEANILREEAKLLPLGDMRDAKNRAARRAEIEARLNRWIDFSVGADPSQRLQSFDHLIPTSLTNRSHKAV